MTGNFLYQGRFKIGDKIRYEGYIGPGTIVAVHDHGILIEWTYPETTQREFVHWVCMEFASIGDAASPRFKELMV